MCKPSLLDDSFRPCIAFSCKDISQVNSVHTKLQAMNLKEYQTDHHEDITQTIMSFQTQSSEVAFRKTFIDLAALIQHHKIKQVEDITTSDVAKNRNIKYLTC